MNMSWGMTQDEGKLLSELCTHTHTNTYIQKIKIINENKCGRLLLFSWCIVFVVVVGCVATETETGIICLAN